MTDTTDTMVNTVVPIIGLGILANMAGNMMRPQRPIRRRARKRSKRAIKNWAI